MDVSISPGNSKMGTIKSVSLPSVVTCRGDAPCFKRCYARRYERRRPTVRQAYERNWELLRRDPDTFWRQVEGAIMTSRFFRFHVSGDIPDIYYLARMAEIAKRQPHCEILCFTKKYDVVNEFLDGGGVLQKNLHIIFSSWQGLPMDNPHGLPEAHVRYRDGSTTAHEGARFCGGNCTKCAAAGEGCWTLKAGEEIVFNEH